MGIRSRCRHPFVADAHYPAGMRPLLLILLAIQAAGCAAQPGSSVLTAPRGSSPAASGPLVNDPLHSIILVNAATGESFTIGHLAAERPVLVEAMAIWCTNCRTQQHAVADAHGQVDFTSISLDVDPNERASDLADYAEREGFNWTFAIADGDLARMLLDRFGSAVLNPPSTPKILFRTDGSIELIALGQVLDAGQIAALIGG